MSFYVQSHNIHTTVWHYYSLSYNAMVTHKQSCCLLYSIDSRPGREWISSNCTSHCESTMSNNNCAKTSVSWHCLYTVHNCIWHCLFALLLIESIPNCEIYPMIPCKKSTILTLWSSNWGLIGTSMSLITMMTQKNVNTHNIN